MLLNKISNNEMRAKNCTFTGARPHYIFILSKHLSMHFFL